MGETITSYTYKRLLKRGKERKSKGKTTIFIRHLTYTVMSFAL